MGKFLYSLLVVAVSLVTFTTAKHHHSKNKAKSSVAYAVYNEGNNEFTISHDPTDGFVAGANYTNSVNQTGWAFLEIWTNADVSDTLQVRAAGFLEGYLTHELIYMYYLNTLRSYCDGRDGYCSKLRSYLETNTKWVAKMSSKLRGTDPFWHQAGLFYEQLDGMTAGWQKAAEKSGHSMGDFGLLWLNIFGDLEDLELAFGDEKLPKNFRPVHKRSLREHEHVVGSGSCSALIKVLPDNADIYASHVSWNAYEAMLRLLKKYHFNIHKTSREGSPLIAGHSMSFSSYPGILYSGDDFTVISSGLVSIETTIGNSNADLWKYVKPTGQVLEGVRCTTANRLARSGKEWADIFGRHNSGTYNNQWMVVDYKKFKPGRPLRDGTLWVLEQLPSVITASDQTDRLRKETHWPSYNSPFYKDIFNLSGTPDLVRKYGDWFTYDKTPRALIFKRDHSKVKDLDSMIRLMRYNDYTHDPVSRCDCNPPYSAENAISARNDLNPRNGTYPFRALSHRSHGGIDMKVTTFSMVPTLDFVAISGPTFDPLPPFQWSKSDFGPSVSHVGQPDLWNFGPVKTHWQH